ncbi:MAG TPA: hypothetical protein VIM11_22290 [Tepidisphaeraceae bacterium]
MKPPRHVAWIVLASIVMIFAAARPACAASPVQAEIDGLRNAYLNLVAGNHNYAGHRARALKEVEDACQLLGLPIKGDGKARQAQKSSDTDLSAAKNYLENVRNIAAGQNQTEVLRHVNAALKEINIALKTK